MSNKRRTYVALNGVQTHQLCTWMQNNKINETTLNAVEVADMASTELGFPISSSTTQRLRREMWPELKRSKKEIDDVNPEHNGIWAAIQALQEQINFIRSAFRNELPL